MLQRGDFSAELPGQVEESGQDGADKGLTHIPRWKSPRCQSHGELTLTPDTVWVGENWKGSSEKARGLR